MRRTILKYGFRIIFNKYIFSEFFQTFNFFENFQEILRTIFTDFNQNLPNNKQIFQKFPSKFFKFSLNYLSVFKVLRKFYQAFSISKSCKNDVKMSRNLSHRHRKIAP